MTNRTKQPIQTDGGAYIEHDVNTEGGDFVARDKNTINIHITQADITRKLSLYNGNFTTHPFEPASVLIPAGSFLMGCDTGIQSRYPIYLPDFRMGKLPITNQEYEYFVRANNVLIPSALGWAGQVSPLDQRQQPVRGVTFQEALAYCQWLSQASGRDYALPTEAHWEKAIRLSVPDIAPENHVYVSHFREWTCSLWGERLQSPDDCYALPWQDDGRNDPRANDQVRRIWRKGAARGNQLPTSRGFPQQRLGFRVMMKIEGVQ